MQTVQPMDTKVCIETYPNFKQFTVSKDGDSHFLYFLNVVYYDPVFTSSEDGENSTVIVTLDISNSFGSLYTTLVLDVLADKTSRDYVCDINIGEDFETVVHELRSYFSFFRLHKPVRLSYVSTLMMGLQTT